MKIETFIRKPTKVKYALSVLNEQYAEFYSTLDDYKQLKNKFTLDHYSQGVMIISNEGNWIQDFKDIDLIIPFWFNSLVAVIDYCNTGKGEMTFQDRAGSLSLKKSYAGFLEIKKNPLYRHHYRHMACFRR